MATWASNASWSPWPLWNATDQGQELPLSLPPALSRGINLPRQNPLSANGFRRRNGVLTERFCAPDKGPRVFGVILIFYGAFANSFAYNAPYFVPACLEIHDETESAQCGVPQEERQCSDQRSR